MIHEFDFSIYPWRLWVAIGASIKEQEEYFKTDIPDWVEGSDGETFTTSKKLGEKKYRHGVLIRFRHKCDMNAEIIAHEAGHAVLELFKNFDCKVDFNNQELLCYPLGFIAYCCEQAKNYKNK
jgi:hypothetical protein